MKKIIFLLFITFVLGSCQQKVEEQMTKLQITGFVENSNLQKAGAKVDDFLLTYDGNNIESVHELGEFRDQARTDEIEITILRNNKKIKLQIPNGYLGVYLKEIVPEHKIEKDAVIIDGIGKLGWDMGMGNTFFGALFRIDEKFGQKTDYNTMMGISGYAFRTSVYEKSLCPSAPDATCGYDTGHEILAKLGYEFDVYHLEQPDYEECRYTFKTQAEMTGIIKNSIDDGYPVIALHLIQTPEWGIITGYQNDDFFCRTFFDKTEEYEIAQKFPWVICVVKNKKEVDISNEFAKSLQTAKELYATEKYFEYFNGLNATKKWIAYLEEEESFTQMNEEKFFDALLANWWMHASLEMAREEGAKYLKSNLDKFGVDKTIIEQIAEIYEKEVTLLKSGYDDVSYPHSAELKWTTAMRQAQIGMLKKFYELEQTVATLLENF
ncbi:MAG: hypothetical protein HN334_05480 [Candidatus Cloacimonetes bacterium]|jgi:hypothetical protein|nr:hypothetical protein [Candidatus Cloacimonadota bacterium]MBT7469881.1 hypothetical protein [Candidatus Cloacimonadota bacterium]